MGVSFFLADSGTGEKPFASRVNRARRLRMRLRVAVLAVDLLAIVLAVGIAQLAKSGGDAVYTVTSIIVPLFLCFAISTQAYSYAILQPGKSIASGLQSLLFAYAVLFLILFLVRVEKDIPRLFLLLTMTISAGLMISFRLAIATFANERLQHRMKAELAIVDGLDIDWPAHMTVIDAEAHGIRPSLSDPTCLNRLAAVVSGMDRIVIACHPDMRERWAMMLKGANVLAEIVVDEIVPFGAFGLSTVGKHETLLVASGPLTLSQRLVKRSFDLAICVPALIVLAPVLIMVALAIKFDSRGPVFFRQRRVGRGNAFFEIFKFRSMHVEHSDSDGRMSTGRHDHRITRVGRFIRRTSLDELPQLLNVLFGSMSLVGPRPHALGSLAGTELFWEVDHRYWHRHACKPGLTGLAQIRGFRGATHRREDLVNRLHADLEYLNNWSIWRDVAILVATVRVLVHPNAF